MGFVHWIQVIFFHYSVNKYLPSVYPCARVQVGLPAKVAYTLHLLSGRAGNCHAIYKDACRLSAQRTRTKDRMVETPITRTESTENVCTRPQWKWLLSNLGNADVSGTLRTEGTDLGADR